MQNSGSPTSSLPIPEGFGKSGLSLMDAEVVCEFMEPRRIEGRWWTHGKHVAEVGPEVWHRNACGPLRTTITTDCMVPRHDLLTLDALHEVEARLSDGQWEKYNELMLGFSPQRIHPRFDHSDAKGLLHATAEQKVRALAATLRAYQEKDCGS